MRFAKSCKFACACAGKFREFGAEEFACASAVQKLWPELDWIQDAGLREKVTKTWELALERSPLTADDLNRIPFTLLVPNCPTTFMEHKRCVVHIARKAAESMTEFMGNALPIDHDTVIAGAILADVGKLWSTRKLTARRVRASAANCCGIRSPAWPWRWSAACPMRSATSLRRTRPKATW